jgi:catechol 2,3-dioxygenase-like lactoylglutathione lyase family enzyme
MAQTALKLRDLKETTLYVDDIARAMSFYCDVLGLPVLVNDARFCALDVNSNHLLLLFLRGASLQETRLSGGVIPPHDGSGPIHVGFAVEVSELPDWEAHLSRMEVPILSRFTWPRGGRSIYFRDPDGHLLEILTPGVWATF